MLTSHAPDLPLHFWCCKQSKTGQWEDALEWASVDYVVVRYQLLWRTIIQFHTVCCWHWNRTEKDACLVGHHGWLKMINALFGLVEQRKAQETKLCIGLFTWVTGDGLINKPCTSCTDLHLPGSVLCQNLQLTVKLSYTYCSRCHLVLLMYVSSCLTLGQQWLRVRCTYIMIFFVQITKCLNNHKAIESVYWLRSVGTINNFLLKDR